MHLSNLWNWTILMPCLNEAETIQTCVRRRWAPAKGQYQGRGSRRRQWQHRRIAGAREELRGAHHRYSDARLRRGAAGGIQGARGKFIIMGDADDSYDFTALDPFVEQLRAGYDLVMGNRFRGGIKPKAMPPLHKYLGIQY